MLNQQIKKTIVDALMKVVDSAPTISNSPKLYANDYLTYRQGYAKQYRTSDENFQSWIDYVFSVLKIVAQHIDSNLSYSVYKEIYNIAYRNSVDNASKTIEICRIILDYAHKIVEM